MGASSFVCLECVDQGLGEHVAEESVPAPCASFIHSAVRGGEFALADPAYAAMTVLLEGIEDARVLEVQRVTEVQRRRGDAGFTARGLAFCADLPADASTLDAHDVVSGDDSRLVVDEFLDELSRDVELDETAFSGLGPSDEHVDRLFPTCRDPFTAKRHACVVRDAVVVQFEVDRRDRLEHSHARSGDQRAATNRAELDPAFFAGTVVHDSEREGGVVVDGGAEYCNVRDGDAVGERRGGMQRNSMSAQDDSKF